MAQGEATEQTGGDRQAMAALISLMAESYEPPELYVAWLTKVRQPGLDDEAFYRMLTRDRDGPFRGEDAERLRERVDELEKRALRLEAKRQQIRAERAEERLEGMREELAEERAKGPHGVER